MKPETECVKQQSQSLGTRLTCQHPIITQFLEIKCCLKNKLSCTEEHTAVPIPERLKAAGSLDNSSCEHQDDFVTLQGALRTQG